MLMVMLSAYHNKGVQQWMRRHWACSYCYSLARKAKNIKHKKWCKEPYRSRTAKMRMRSDE